MPRCRGVTQWTDQRSHRLRPAIAVIAPIMDARVVGLDAVTGQTRRLVMGGARPQ